MRKYNPRPSYMPKFVPQSNCVLYMEGQQDPQSSTIRDLSGNGYNATLTNAVFTKIESGLSVLDFSAANSKAVFSGISISAQAAISVMIWFKAGGFTGANREMVDMGYWEVGNDGFSFWLDDLTNTLGFRSGSDEGTLDSFDVAFTPNKWTHAAMIYDGANVMYYKDGVDLAADDPVVGEHYSINASTTMGSRITPALYYNGLMWGFRVFTSALTSSQMAGIYQQERHLFGV